MKRGDRVVVLASKRRGTFDSVSPHSWAILVFLDGDTETTSFLAHELEYAGWPETSAR
jgi:hypothetical protein